MNKYDLYVGKPIFCSCGSNCGKTYEVVSEIYEENGEEVFDIKDDNTGEVEKLSVEYLEEYIEY